MKKLIFFGDSLLAQAGKHRIRSLENKLDGQYDVYNCAAGGWNSLDLLRKADYIARLNPDVILLSLGTNDMAPWKQVELSTFIDSTKKAYEKLGAKKIIYFLPPPFSEQLMQEPHVITNQHAAKYYDSAKTISDNFGLATINSRKIFMPLLENGTVYHTEDGIHLQDNAYDLIFDAVREVLI